jgi:hypothetical protein
VIPGGSECTKIKRKKSATIHAEDIIEVDGLLLARILITLVPQSYFNLDIMNGEDVLYVLIAY